MTMQTDVSTLGDCGHFLASCFKQELSRITHTVTCYLMQEQLCGYMVFPAQAQGCACCGSLSLTILKLQMQAGKALRSSSPNPHSKQHQFRPSDVFLNSRGILSCGAKTLFFKLFQNLFLPTPCLSNSPSLCSQAYKTLRNEMSNLNNGAYSS